jgi:single-strand DNA-binding protein
MEIVGRLTADAKVSTLKDKRQVVNFSIAINDSYKPKDSEQPVKITNYVNCSYWINPAIEEFLKKGSLVELSGRIGVNAWTNAEGEAKASLTFHVNNLKLHGGVSVTAAIKEKVTDAADVTVPMEDLPF